MIASIVQLPIRKSKMSSAAGISGDRRSDKSTCTKLSEPAICVPRHWVGRVSSCECPGRSVEGAPQCRVCERTLADHHASLTSGPNKKRGWESFLIANGGRNHFAARDRPVILSVADRAPKPQRTRSTTCHLAWPNLMSRNCSSKSLSHQ
jgi:hypothetical protein